MFSGDFHHDLIILIARAGPGRQASAMFSQPGLFQTWVVLTFMYLYPSGNTSWAGSLSTQ